MTKISQLPAATAIQAADTVIVNQGGVTKRGTLTLPWSFGGDVSVAGNLPVSGTVTGVKVLTGDGSAAVPSFSFANNPTAGLMYETGAGTGMYLISGAIKMMRIGATPIFGPLGVSFSTASDFTSASTNLVLDATNVLAQRNGAFAQTYRVYNTFTDVSNFEHGFLRYNGNVFELGSAALGTGVVRDISIVIGGTRWATFNSSGDLNLARTAPGPFFGSSAAADLRIGTNGTTRWIIQSAGHLIANIDNTYDFGAAGATRARTGYFGTGIDIGAGATPFVARVTNGNYAYVDTASAAGGANGTGGWAIRDNSPTLLMYFRRAGGSGELMQIGSPAASITSMILGGGAVGSVQSITLVTDNNIKQANINHTASAVNWLTLTGGATTVGATLAVDGETNVDLRLAAKGTGVLRLLTAGADIQWGRANVALGGGAAPTVGTIGGSGPAAAAQRNWLRFIESDGTASFIPVWR